MVWWLTGSISIVESLLFITVLWSNVGQYYKWLKISTKDNTTLFEQVSLFYAANG
jgi:hypothetical protein